MKKVLPLMAVLLLLQVVAFGAEKPDPPERLTDLFTAVVEIEDAVTHQQWARARQSITEIDDILTALRASSGASAYNALVQDVVVLKQALQGQNADLLSQPLINLQKNIFRSMDGYHYTVHPAFAVIQQYVAEAFEAAEAKDFARVAHEMKEIANIITVSAAVMVAKGVGKGMQRDFQEQLVAVVNAARTQDQQQTLAILKKAKITAGAFVWLGSQQ